MPRSAFTLIELLVVIAVIAILIAVLLPALAGVRSGGVALQSASNMRQLAIGHATYAVDNDGVSIPGRMAKVGAGEDRVNQYHVGNGKHYRPRWMVTMGASAGFYAYNEPSTDPSKDNDNNRHVEHEVLVDPSRPDWTNNRNYAFGYNFQFLGNSRKDADDQYVNFPVRLSTLRTKTVLFAPTLGTAATFAEDERDAYNPAPHPNKSARELANHGWSLDPPRLHADGDNCDGGRDGVTRSAPDERHNGKANVAFLDGHIKAMTAEQLGYMRNDDGSFAYCCPDADNTLFSGDGDADTPPVR